MMSGTTHHDDEWYTMMSDTTHHDDEWYTMMSGTTHHDDEWYQQRTPAPAAALPTSTGGELRGAEGRGEAVGGDRVGRASPRAGRVCRALPAPLCARRAPSARAGRACSAAGGWSRSLAASRAARARALAPCGSRGSKTVRRLKSGSTCAQTAVSLRTNSRQFAHKQPPVGWARGAQSAAGRAGSGAAGTRLAGELGLLEPNGRVEAAPARARVEDRDSSRLGNTDGVHRPIRKCCGDPTINKRILMEFAAPEGSAAVAL
jgi:hypothetical protein